jgi:hypothetical protein
MTTAATPTSAKPCPNHSPNSRSPGNCPGLIAAWNGAFRITNGDAKGGFYLDGRTVAGLRDGQASEVIKRDGSIAIGQWGRDVTMTPDVVGVRQNLELLVDNGQVVPAVDSSDHNLWGVTVDNRYFVWRSGVGITADGNIVYAMGPAAVRAHPRRTAAPCGRGAGDGTRHQHRVGLVHDL